MAENNTKADSEKKHLCQECGSSFNRPYRLLRHMLIHRKNEKKDENNIKVDAEKNHVCKECGVAFSRPYRLFQHMLLHSNIKAFACGEANCNKSYTSKSHLDRHILSVHIQSNFVVINRCPDCKKMFSNRQNLKRHIKIKHSGKKDIFTCDVCSTDFKKKHLLTSHMYQHTYVKSFSCDFCTKDFITLHEKKKHLKYHKTYACDLCDMAFSHWSKYQKHKQIVHHVREYICNECGRKFKQRQHIVRHVKIHMSQPVFKCWYKDCNRIYTRHSNLRQHIRIKHLDLTHPCGICGVKLCTKPKLRAHIQLMHTNERAVKKQPTLAEGRKVRKDKGILKASTALKIAGLMDTGSKIDSSEISREYEVREENGNHDFIDINNVVTDKQDNEILNDKQKECNKELNHNNCTAVQETEIITNLNRKEIKDSDFLRSEPMVIISLDDER